MEEYVLGAMLAEVTPLGESAPVVARVYDVQSVIARTYAVSHLGRHRAEGFDVCDTTHCQRFDPARAGTSRFAPAARESVARTRGRILMYGGFAAEALYHADCGGSTAAADTVWGGRAVPYLQAVTDDLPGGTHRPWRVSATTDEMRAALNADARTAVGRELRAIEVVSRDDSGRAAGLGVRGERSYTVRGDVLRAVINQALGERAVQSTRFTLARSGDRYVFEGTGFGHGVGLCQRGAIARARRGDSLEGILGTYFAGTRLR
jgi:stage II sporulation protein D